MVRKNLKKLVAKTLNCKSCAAQFVRPSHKNKFYEYLYEINGKAIRVMIVAAVAQFFLMSFVAGAGELTGVSLLECTNSLRAEQGLDPLYMNNKLSIAATLKLEDMKYYKYWAHANPETGMKPWDFVDTADYYYLTTGENLAIGYMDSDEVCNAWAESQTHFENIINPTYQEIGFAIERADLDENGKGLLVVQMFGSRSDFDPEDPEAQNDDIAATFTSEDQEGATPSVKAASHEKDNESSLSTFMEWLIKNIALIIIISGYFFIRSVIICKRQHRGKIQPRCIVILGVFLIMTVASITVLYVNNLLTL